MIRTGDGQDRVHLGILGRIALTTVAGEARPILVQPKRLAVLLWIALRRPGGFVRRDEMLGVFWPESTEERARASLRQALQFLRRHLGADVIVRRGDAELGIDDSIVSCDALAFLDAIRRGDDAAAVAQYGGDLMPGFLLDGAYDFDRWLHAERQRFRTLAIESARGAAASAEGDGDTATAAQQVSWAHRLEPTDEGVARRLMLLLARSGNRPAAVAAYESFAERLREELDLEPSPQTAGLCATIRDEMSDVVRTGGADGGSRVSSPQRILVLELENRTGDDRFDVLGSLAGETLARGLADIDELEVVPFMAVPASGSTMDDGVATTLPADVLSPAVADLARRTGAGTVLSGSVHRESGTLWFRVRVTDVASGRMLRGPEPVRADEAAPIEGLELLRERVVTAIAPALTHRVVHVRHATRPPGIEAYRAYLAGLACFVRGDWRASLDHFGRATELAPEYALPRVVSAIALWNLGDLTFARRAVLDAEAISASPGRFERAVLDMVHAWLSGDWAAAHRAAVVQAEMAPGSIPHFQVAEESRRLSHPREARDLLRRLDPETGELRGWIFYWVELATAHHQLRDHETELEVASRCRQLHPHEPLAALLEVRAFAGLGRSRDVIRVCEQVLASSAGRKPATAELLLEAALELHAHGDAAEGDAMMERAVECQRAAGVADDAHRRRLARALYYAGEFDEAHAMFSALAQHSRGAVQHVSEHHAQLQAHLDEGFLAAIAARRGDADEAERWCSFLEALDGPFLYGAQWFWLAAVAAIRGDRERAIRMLRRAFADGLPMEMFIHTDPHLASLRNDERLSAILRPRG